MQEAAAAAAAGEEEQGHKEEVQYEKGQESACGRERMEGIWFVSCLRQGSTSNTISTCVLRACCLISISQSINQFNLYTL